MFSASDLSEDQIETIRKWVAEGAQMAEVQKRLNEEFGFKVTYMDTRFLSLDLDLQFESQDEDGEAEAPAPSALVGGGDTAAGVPPEAGGVSATLDEVARPGAMVSGTVTFSDGVKGMWLIDEMGRPSIDPDQPGYQPSESDLVAFQEKLRVLLDGKI